MTSLVTKQALSQFTINLSRGFVYRDGGIRSVNGILANADPAQITSVGDMVKLVANPNGDNEAFGEVTATDTSGYGFVRKNLKQTEYKTKDLYGNCEYIAVARNYDVMVGVANSALEVGDPLVYLQASGKLESAAQEEPDEGIIACGIAVSRAAPGELVKFEIRL
ncbi:MAG: hypothetical protein LBU15_04555 [Rickettsiales bacterium]|jgi:hypothetical protein|nr:hypothetical protein [Rickettsiales bacterium]